DAFARHTEEAVVLAQAGHESRLHPLELESQHVEHVGPLDRFLDAAEHVDAEIADVARQQCARRTYGDFRTQLREAPDVGARDARVQHVAHDTDAATLDRSAMVADREDVEQSLRRMLVPAIARVDHVRRDAVGEELRGTGRGVTDHDHVDPHRLEIARRVDERLALLHAGSRGRDVHGICGQPLLGELERDACARRRLEEQVDDRLAAQHRHLLDRALADLLERLGGVEDRADLFRTESLEAGEVLPQRGGLLNHGVPPRGAISTASRPSSSGTSTSTTWSGRASMVRPTMSGWIGSSRPPRSIRTHSQMRAGRPKSASSSSAARAVRPVYRTSSTITRLVPSMPPGGSRVSPMMGRGPIAVRSSRYSVMSRVPTGGRWLSARSISSATRAASCTPRRWMPTTVRCCMPLL